MKNCNDNDNNSMFILNYNVHINSANIFLHGRYTSVIGTILCDSPLYNLLQY